MTGRLLNSSHRPSRLLAGLAVLLPAVAAGWAFHFWRSNSDRLDAAKADLSECQRLVTDIERLRFQPRVAALDQETSSAITRRVSQSMQTASLPVSALVRVEPQAPVRVNRTQYLLRATRIELRDVTLEQVVRFTHALRDTEQGSVVRKLVLTEPQSQSGPAERWLAEITLTQSIFSPTIR